MLAAQVVVLIKTFCFIDKDPTEERIKELTKEILQMRTKLEFQERLINYF